MNNNTNLDIVKNKALFLDRDGVICEAVEDGKYLTRPEEFVLMSGIQDVINTAKNVGYIVVVVTNQAAIAKRLITEKILEKIHSKMQALLDGKINKIYYCPHSKTDECDCRKPKPGMIIQAVKDLNIDISRSIMVGDKDTDIQAGQAAGCKTIFINGPIYGHLIGMCSPDKVIKNLSELLPFLVP
jgi:histidinol-phosphate phosphatase family protein